jgi:hypothetical protein
MHLGNGDMNWQSILVITALEEARIGGIGHVERHREIGFITRFYQQFNTLIAGGCSDLGF